jgi:8-oxo-dGTP diphosphatase
MKRVAAAVIEKGGRILIAKRRADSRHAAGKWEFPGGTVEGQETPEESLRRELHEELGIETEVGSFVVSSEYMYPHGCIELLAYRVCHVSGDFMLHDHEQIEWVTPDEMDDYDFAPADIAVVRRIQECSEGLHREDR